MMLVVTAAAALSMAAASPEALATVARMKQIFIIRVDACTPPQQCGSLSASLLERAETEFVQACQACAPADRCEAERAKIREGKGKRSENPCS
jgi:hypothetical protein